MSEPSVTQPALFAASALAARPQPCAAASAPAFTAPPVMSCEPGVLRTWRYWDSASYAWAEYPYYEVPLAENSFTPPVPCCACGGRLFRTHYSIPTDAAGRPFPKSLAHWTCAACQQPLPEMRLAWWDIPDPDVVEVNNVTLSLTEVTQ